MNVIKDDLSIEILQFMKNYYIQEGDINLLNLVSQVKYIIDKSIIKSKHNQKQTCITNFFNKL